MTGIWYLSTFDPRIVYIPFVDMIRGPVDTVLNIILFIPLGIFLPLLYKKYDKCNLRSGEAADAFRNGRLAEPTATPKRKAFAQSCGLITTV